VTGDRPLAANTRALGPGLATRRRDRHGGRGSQTPEKNAGNRHSADGAGLVGGVEAGESNPRKISINQPNGAKARLAHQLDDYYEIVEPFPKNRARAPRRVA
jgi:hypothetical protein